tara:strand:+ start:819 stop:1466 length:648 start_codon:yes stop_codon:yes gene_type:complete
LLTIIQARCSSKRFPNKILKKIYGKPLIGHLINRLKRSKKISKIIVATSKDKSDDKLIKYLRQIKIKFYRGELDDVASRLLSVAQNQKKKSFIRINGDSPLIDPNIIEKAIRIFKKNSKYHLITNVFPRTFPKGQSVEIINTQILKKNILKMSTIEREHVTKFFYKNSGHFLIKNFVYGNRKKNIKLAIDNKKDLSNILKKIKKDEFKKYSILDL